jgi:hypothetical protein
MRLLQPSTRNNVASPARIFSAIDSTVGVSPKSAGKYEHGTLRQQYPLQTPPHIELFSTFSTFNSRFKSSPLLL